MISLRLRRRELAGPNRKVLALRHKWDISIISDTTDLKEIEPPRRRTEACHYALRQFASARWSGRDAQQCQGWDDATRRSYFRRQVPHSQPLPDQGVSVGWRRLASLGIASPPWPVVQHLESPCRNVFVRAARCVWPDVCACSLLFGRPRLPHLVPASADGPLQLTTSARASRWSSTATGLPWTTRWRTWRRCRLAA